MQDLDSKEKSRISTLRREHDSSASTKLDWMYANPTQTVENEEYLLGRAVDSTKNHVEHECIPPSLRDLHGAADADQVDIARKLQEDPLLEIHRREVEARKQMLQNPIKLKQMQQQLLKKTKESDSSGDDLDKKLLEKYMKLKTLTWKSKKSKRAKSSKSDEDEEPIQKNKKKKKSDKSKSEDSSKHRRQIHEDKYRKGESKSERRYKDGDTKIDSRQSNNYSNKNYNRYSDRHHDNKHDEKLSSKRRRSRSHEHRSEKRSSSNEKRSKRDSHSSRKRSKSREYKIDVKQKKHRRSRSNEKSKSKQTEDKYHQAGTDSSDHEKQDHGRNTSSVIRSSRSRTPAWNPSKSPESSDEHKPVYGLKTALGAKIKIDRNKERPVAKPTSDSNKTKQWVRPEKQKLTEEEKEKRRQEMLENVRWKEAANAKSQGQDQGEENTTDFEYNPDFIKKYILKSADNSSIESRIKSNINNIQRRKIDLDKNFVRR